MGLSLLFGDLSDSQGAAGRETGVTMTSTDLDLDLSQWQDLDIDMTNVDMMVEGVPANVQYDTGAKVCLITTNMVVSLRLLRHREACLMELTSALGVLPVISSRRHRLHFRTGRYQLRPWLSTRQTTSGHYQPCMMCTLTSTCSHSQDVLLSINAAHLHTREEKLHSGVKLLHSCVLGNYLLSGMMIADSVDTPMGPLIKYRSLSTELVASVASMPALLAAARMAPVDQLHGASVGTKPQRRTAPTVCTAPAHQNYGLQQEKGLARAGEKMLPKGTISGTKMEPVARTGHLGRLIGACCFILSQKPN